MIAAAATSAGAATAGGADGGEVAATTTTEASAAAASEPSETAAPTPSSTDREGAAHGLEWMHRRLRHLHGQLLRQEARLAETPPPASVRRGLRPRAGVKFRGDDAKYEGVSLPDPADGLMHTPAEAVANVRKLAEGNPRPGRSDVRLFKEKMIASGMVPVAIARLNHLLKDHGGLGQPPAPR